MARYMNDYEKKSLEEFYKKLEEDSKRIEEQIKNKNKRL